MSVKRSLNDDGLSQIQNEELQKKKFAKLEENASAKETKSPGETTNIPDLLEPSTTSEVEATTIVEKPSIDQDDPSSEKTEPITALDVSKKDIPASLESSASCDADTKKIEQSCEGTKVLLSESSDINLGSVDQNLDDPKLENADRDTEEGNAETEVKDEVDGWFSHRGYNMKSASPPCVFIFNNSVNRPGSIEDACKLSTLFENTLGFRIITDNKDVNPPVWDNLSATRFKDIISNQISGPAANYCDVSAVFIVIMTHGIDNGKLLFHGNDGSEYTSEVDIQKDIVEEFCSRNPTLVGKPKVFIIPTCRGVRHYPGMVADSVDSGDTLPVTSDVLIAYATNPGQVSLRDWVHGTWYVDEFVKVVEKHYKNHHLTEMLEKVNNRVAKRTASDGCTKVMPQYTSMLRKNLYLKFS